VSPRHEALGRIALIDFLRGWPGKAEATARAAVAVAERAGLPPARCSGIAHVVLAAVAVDRDALPDARAALHQAAVSAGGHTDPVVTAGVVILRSRLLLAGGDPPAALEALSEGDDRSQAGVRSPWVAARLALAAATAQLVQGHPGAALDAVKGLEGPDTAAPRIPECALIAARARIAVGQSAAAARILDALPDGPAVGPVTTVRTLLARAEIADRLGEQAAARRLAVRALDHARPEQLRRPFLEAGPWLARVLHGRQATADPWLPGAIVGHAAPTAATGAHAVVVEPLSEREQDVLRCVAEMKSTQEVADELFLSVNTVKSHLKSIFRKLSATRRGEAVRRARELDLL
jgi:LuxR family maltose regulon positive regulatory protein